MTHQEYILIRDALDKLKTQLIDSFDKAEQEITKTFNQE